MMMKVAVPQRFKLRVVPDVKTLIFGPFSCRDRERCII